MNIRNRGAARPMWLLLVALVAFPAHALRVGDLGHLHGLAFDPNVPGALLLATHYGLYRALPDGSARPISDRRDDFMALAADPSEPGVLYVSGHPLEGGNLGLLRSRDGGESWAPHARESGEPADYHQLVVSPADPRVLYGVHGSLQASRDGGRSWEVVGPPPEKLITLAGSADHPGHLYAATQAGLLTSRDGGRQWRAETESGNTASLVHITSDGTVYTFVLGRGLLRASAEGGDWQTLYNGFGSHYPLWLAVDPGDRRHLVTLTHAGGLFTSDDGGESWRRFPEPRTGYGTVAGAGKRLYDEYCISCHGIDGVGETAGTATAPSEPGKLAPALDFATHAWHHDDQQLVETILEGGIARGGRMPPWKALLSEANARELVAYMKSLWRPRELACQGARHMNCDWVPETRP